jgi:uroporphyrinogen decarboxylase
MSHYKVKTHTDKLDEIALTISHWIKENPQHPQTRRLEHWVSSRKKKGREEPFIELFTWVGLDPELRSLGLSLLEMMRGMRLTDIMQIAGRRMIFLLVGIVMAKLNNTRLKENIMDPEVAVASLAHTAKTLQTEVTFSCVPDISAFAESYGCEVKIPDNSIAMVTKHSVQTRDDLGRLESEGPQWHERLLNNFKVLGGMVERFTTFKLALGGGPFSMAAVLAGVENLARKTIKDPEFVERLVDFCSGISIMACQGLVSSGANIIYLGDPTSGLLSRKQYERFAAPYIKRVVDAVDCPFVLHICGKSSHIIEPMCATGVQGISLDSVVDMPSIAPLVPSNVAIIGNLDPVGALLNGTPEEAAVVTKNLLESMRHVPNYMFSCGCEVALETPPENIKAMIEMVKDYR